jgi:AcrR family transcriptional regulator
MTQRAVKKRATHERILKSADKIARREGLRAASVPRVMKGAGLTIGGFYAHFSSKTALDVELIRRMLGDVPGHTVVPDETALAAATSRSRYLPPPRTGLGTQPSKTRIGYADGIVTNNERTTILSE